MTGKVLTFYLKGRLFGIDLLAVKEINRRIEATPVPGAPPYVVGLLNMRGQVVTLFDLAALMGMEQGKPGAYSTCIILKTTPDNPDYTGFLVDAAGSVCDVALGMRELPPANTGNEARFIGAVIKLENQLAPIIDHQVILANNGA